MNSIENETEENMEAIAQAQAIEIQDRINQYVTTPHTDRSTCTVWASEGSVSLASVIRYARITTFSKNT